MGGIICRGGLVAISTGIVDGVRVTGASSGAASSRTYRLSSAASWSPLSPDGSCETGYGRRVAIWLRIRGMKSVFAILLGVVLALVVGILVVFGIFAPVLSVVFGLDRLAPSAALPAVLLVFATAFAFYWGGMSAAYRAPSRRALHGALVGVVAFGISAAVNLVAGRGPFPRIDSSGAVLLLLAVLVASVGAGYVGGRRGASLHAYNQQFSPRKPRKESARKEREG